MAQIKWNHLNFDGTLTNNIACHVQTFVFPLLHQALSLVHTPNPYVRKKNDPDMKETIKYET